MGSFLDRKMFNNINQYQARIIRLVVVPVFFFFAFLTYFLIEIQHEQVQLVLFGTRMAAVHFIDKWLVPIIIVVWCMFFYVCFLAYRVSSELVGPFARINRELDLIIRGESRHHIKARDEDELAHELLERVNIMIDNLPPPKTPLKIR